MTQTATLDSILQTVRRFVDEEIIPLEPQLLREGLNALMPTLMQKRETVREMGLWGIALPKEHDGVEVGGLGLRLAEFGQVSEELGRSILGHIVFNCNAPDIGNMELLLAYGSTAQQERWMMPLMRGEIRSCFSMTEPAHAGSNPTWMSTTAVKDENDYVINGHKWYTTAADGAQFAIVMAVTDPEAESRHQRASQIIVPTDAPGFELVRNIPVMGQPEEGIFSHGEIRYTDVRVPQSNRIGEEGAGFALAQTRLGPGRIHHCMRWIGICERAFDLMCQQAVSREVAPGRFLGDQQIVQTWIAESRAEINAARLMVLQTAARIDSAKTYAEGTYAKGTYAARDDISIIKFYVAGVLQRVLDRAIQAHGGLGMSDDLPLAYWFRHERAARIYDGPDEVHKIAVARRILRKYR